MGVILFVPSLATNFIGQSKQKDETVFIMITIISYISILTGFLIFTTIVYLGLLKIKLI